MGEGRAAAGQQIISYIVDTHALFWYLTASPRLSRKAKESFEEVDRGEALIYIPAIVLAELYFLNEKLGRPVDFASGVAALLNHGQFYFVPFNGEDTLEFDSYAAVPEMHDRIIVGVARRLNAACITTDRQIVQSGLVATVW